MKRIILLLLAIALVFSFTTQAMAAKNINADVYIAAATEIDTATRITWNTALPANFAGIAAVMKAYKTVEAADVTITGDAAGTIVTATGVTAVVSAKTGMTNVSNATTVGILTGNGIITHQCLDDGVVLLVCAPLAASKEILDFTTETWDAAAVNIATFANITQ